MANLSLLLVLVVTCVSAQWPFGSQQGPQVQSGGLFSNMDQPSNSILSSFPIRQFILLIQSRPIEENDFFVGKFRSDPRIDPQVNMFKVYQKLGLPGDYVDRNATIEIIRVNKTDTNQTMKCYKLKQSFSNNEKDDVVEEYEFQLGVENTTNILGLPADFLVEAEEPNKLYLTYNLTNFGTLNAKFVFTDEPSGMEVYYKLPGGIHGKREFECVC